MFYDILIPLTCFPLLTPQYEVPLADVTIEGLTAFCTVCSILHWNYESKLS